MSFYTSLYISTCISLIGVLALYMLVGLTGIFSMGQAAFMAVGAYAAGLLALRSPLPAVVNVVLAVLIGMLFAYGVGLPVIKLRRDYIALITLAFGEAIVALLNNATGFTGGSLGLNGIPRMVNAPLVTVCLVACIYFVVNFKRSRFGRQCLAVKSDEISAEAMGINTNRVKMIAFVLAGGLTAFSGALWAYLTTYVEPNAFAQKLSIEWIIVVFIGGVNSLSGSLTAGVLLYLLPEVLRFTSNLRIIIYSVIVLAVINFMPRGLFGAYEFTDIFRAIWHFILRILGRQIPMQSGRMLQKEED